MSKFNMLAEIRAKTGDEYIEGVVFGKWKKGWPGTEPETLPPSGVLTIEQAEPFLDREFDGGYGCFEGFYFTAWSKSLVVFWGTYDGAQWIEAVPRNPCLTVVEPVGGGLGG